MAQNTHEATKELKTSSDVVELERLEQTKQMAETSTSPTLRRGPRGRRKAAFALSLGPLSSAVRCGVYVDGFNLYYGAVKGTPNKWLDLGAAARALLPDDQIVVIRYFTAKVEERGARPGSPIRQQLYLRALATIPHLEIHFGQFQVDKATMPLVKPEAGRTKVRVWKTSEKGSDVNLASWLLLDAFEKRWEKALVITADSDLVTPITLAKEHLGVDVGIAFPTNRHSKHLATLTWIRKIHESTLKACQFPDTLEDSKGSFSKPADW
jgi:hypothetical protein